ncbi:MAG: DNA-3-methyladenine glycosylase [Alphaproteobacteria bacterium]|jgi:DNA-3-methyladenine glycosylase
MLKTSIPVSEYLLDPFVIARDVLLGATLYSYIDGKLTGGKIIELELYLGDCDRACHAYPNKKTSRNSVMFDIGGRAYIYFVYGMHNMFNVVISDIGQANAILIRALEPVIGIEIMQERRKINKLEQLCNGPAKLTKALGITTKFNGIDLTNNKNIWIEPRKEKTLDIITGKRIGIDYAGPDADLPWRFAIKDNKFISKKI